MSGLSLLSDIAQTGHENGSQKNESFAEANQTDAQATSNQVCQVGTEDQNLK